MTTTALAAALADVDIDHYVRQPDGRPLPQSSAPAIIESLIHLADIQQGHRVMEIGTGSGYSTAVLATLVGRSGSVTSVEVDASVADRATKKLTGMPNVTVVHGDGSAGATEAAPFDRVIAWTTPNALPETWVTQTVDRGRIVTPVKVAELAAANLTVTAIIANQRPTSGAFHDGSFVDMAPAGADYRIPYYYIDAQAVISDHPVWLSAPTLRHQPDKAATALRTLANTIGRPAFGAWKWSELLGHLLATDPTDLATIQLPRGRGIGYVTEDSTAIAMGDSLITTGEASSFERLTRRLLTFEQSSLVALTPQFSFHSDGWRVTPRS